MSSSINVSKHALYNGSLIGLSEVSKTSLSGREWSGLKYYTNGIEVDTRKSMNCQPISDTGQVIKEINKGPSGEKRDKYNRTIRSINEDNTWTSHIWCNSDNISLFSSF